MMHSTYNVKLITILFWHETDYYTPALMSISTHIKCNVFTYLSAPAAAFLTTVLLSKSRGAATFTVLCFITSSTDSGTSNAVANVCRPITLFSAFGDCSCKQKNKSLMILACRMLGFLF